jgi:murein L,D-transpeptidase YcbB/YkuD
MKHCLLSITALVLCAANTVPQVPVPGWTPVHIARLKHWTQAAPEDALPLLDTSQLDAAVRGPDQAAIDRMATALALRLARMHLLGSATSTEQTGWRIADSDGAIDLQSWLERAVSGGSLDPFFEGLRPQHLDYAVLRAAFAAEKGASRRLTLARNMERWRWMPQSLGPDYVLVNAASFEASLWRQGQPAGTWKVIVGKTRTPTPVFSATHHRCHL